MTKNLSIFNLNDIPKIRENIINDTTISKEEKIHKFIKLIDNIGQLELNLISKDEQKKSFYEASKELTQIIKKMATYDIKYSKYIDSLVLNYTNYKNKNTLEGYFSQYLNFEIKEDKNSSNKNFENDDKNKSKEDKINISFNEFMLLLLKELKTNYEVNNDQSNGEDKKQISEKFFTFIYNKYPNLKHLREIESSNLNLIIKNDDNIIKKSSFNKDDIILKVNNRQNRCFCLMLIIIVVLILLLIYKYQYYYCFQVIEDLILTKRFSTSLRVKAPIVPILNVSNLVNLPG